MAESAGLLKPDNNDGELTSPRTGGSLKGSSIFHRFEQKNSLQTDKPAVIRGQGKSRSFVVQADKCKVCNQRVYLNEKLSADGAIFHKACFRCNECNSVLKLGNYASLEGNYYCKPHFKQLFKLKGNYAEGFGQKKPDQLWREGKGEVLPDSAPVVRPRIQEPASVIVRPTTTATPSQERGSVSSIFLNNSAPEAEQNESSSGPPSSRGRMKEQFLQMQKEKQEQEKREREQQIKNRRAKLNKLSPRESLSKSADDQLQNLQSQVEHLQRQLAARSRELEVANAKLQGEARNVKEKDVEMQKLQKELQSSRAELQAARDEIASYNAQPRSDSKRDLAPPPKTPIYKNPGVLIICTAVLTFIACFTFFNSQK
eukprot:CAMPEP_0174253362 /NCGR_PEP_ID=MMETSP0439-20130205/2738_1 /TAXON_ID=0 /ORGANISM="Stereomyxa ramosa, Strain Chinc5" /LENGTH=370 /DNA_ID=CAMNT_0015334349 /DNA_START=24 /DNA_END=1136 /DNA_ORIENTATION=-